LIHYPLTDKAILVEGNPVAAEPRFSKSDWALILGSSSGFGGATAIELARHGMSILGVHFDRAATMPNVKQILQEIKAAGSKVLFFNVNAADPQRRNETLDTISKEFSSDPTASVRVLLHSLAFGTLKPYVTDDQEEMITQAQMEMTLDVMANSLVYWVQGLLQRKLIRRGARIFAMTSSGGHTVMPSYGAVSAAKAALESHMRQLAMELGRMGITANSIMAGVTDTPALRKIPGGLRLLKAADYKNPAGRVTTPSDVARAIALLSDERSQWISGNVIKVDGGEDGVGFVSQDQPVHIE
jgi:enoyl-[acyl-carrier protein] reductase III